MKITSLRALFGAALLALSSLPAAAITIDPQFTNFGLLSQATFGGSGIPNHAVAITTFGNVTLGLTATQRFSNPAVTNDGAGTFFAQAGSDPANSAYAKWNFNYYISGLSSGQSVTLYYDKNPATGNDVTATFPGLFMGTQNSWNLGMGHLGGGFNPSASGEYDFALVLSDSTGELARSAITVKVGSPSVPDGGTTIGLMGAALVGLVALRRFRAAK